VGYDKAKKMFYNEKETGEIQKLVSLLSNENYRKIQERLCKKGLRNGFTCLFTGGLGTGKTETAYQIARQTGRNIMAVNIVETKSMFFGERFASQSPREPSSVHSQSIAVNV